jgi:TRAP-type C4-dicarboxylate transport system permease small subunit
MARKPSALVGAVLEFVGAAALLALMLVVVVDVGGRSLFNRPLPWGTELLEVVLAVMIFCFYPLLGIRGTHITVDLITVRPALHRVQRILAAVVGCVLFAIVAFCLGRQGIRSLGYGDASALLQIPTGVVLWGMSVLAGATAIAFLIGLGRAIGNTPEVPHPNVE